MENFYYQNILKRIYKIIYYYDIIGIIGVSIIIISYFLLQINQLSIDNIKFSILNIIGSVLILYSLSYNWNLSSVIIESFWIIISFIGVYKYLVKRCIFFLLL